MNDVVSFGLESFRNRLAPSNRNQARKDDRSPRLAIDGEPANSKGLHLAFEDCPFIIDDSRLIFALLKTAPVEVPKQLMDSRQVVKALRGDLQAPLAPLAVFDGDVEPGEGSCPGIAVGQYYVLVYRSSDT